MHSTKLRKGPQASCRSLLSINDPWPSAREPLLAKGEHRVAVSLYRSRRPKSQSPITCRVLQGGLGHLSSYRSSGLLAPGLFLLHGWCKTKKKKQTQNTAVSKQRRPPRWQGSDQSQLPSWLCTGGRGSWDMRVQSIPLLAGCELEKQVAWGAEPKEEPCTCVTAGEAASTCPPSPPQCQRQQAALLSRGRDAEQPETEHLSKFPHNSTS